MKPAESEILQFRRTSPGFSASISIEPFINAKQASELLHLSAKTLLRFARQGIVPAHPLTGKTRRQRPADNGASWNRSFTPGPTSE
jgi:hypothetical protein